MDSNVSLSRPTFSLLLPALAAFALSACGTSVDVGDFEDGSGGAGGSTGVGRGGDDTPATTTTGSTVTGTSTGSTGNGGGSTTTTGVTTTTTGGTGGAGTVCGGFAGDTCAETDFCDFEGGSCDFADDQGTCQPRPQACPFDVVVPVCACDGEVYQSECWANLAGVDVTAVPGACGGNPQPCGGKSGEVCADDQYCDFDSNSCGFADEQGLCRPRPTQCPGSGGDVPCACDGQNYPSACEAARHGADVWGGVDFCDPPEFCGGIAGLTCAGDQFCDYEDASFCGGDDSLGVCRSRPDSCPTDPPVGSAVCGCDAEVYPSECEANLAGVDATSADILECGGA